MDKNAARVQLQGKSLGLGVVLTLVVGGLGMFYLSVWWGVIGLFCEGLAWILSFLTGGLFSFLLIGWRVVAVIVTVVSINNHNRRLLDSLD